MALNYPDQPWNLCTLCSLLWAVEICRNELTEALWSVVGGSAKSSWHQMQPSGASICWGVLLGGKQLCRKGHQDEHEPEMCPRGKEGLWCPGLHWEECCQQAVGGDTSPLFSIGEATLALCEQWGWIRWPPELPNNLSLVVTLWFYENSIFPLLATEKVGYGKLAGGSDVILTKRARCTITAEIEN